MKRSDRYTSALIGLAFGAVVLVAPIRANHRDLQPVNGVKLILETFNQYQVVAIADLPGCDELHRFIRSLVAAPEFSSKVNTIVVGFGNPLFQPVIDRYVLDGELVPRYTLRHVWDDTSESPDLTWDSPVYAEFFDAVRVVNLTLPKDKRIHVVLGGAPISWRKVKTNQQWLAFRGAARDQALAAKLKEVLAHNQHVLVIDSPSQLLRTRNPVVNARALVEKAHPGQFFSILPQGRFGTADAYKKIEVQEQQIPIESIALIQGTWLGAVPLNVVDGSARVEDVAEAVLFLGDSTRLTKIQPSGDLFRDDDFWIELTSRWKVVHGEPFELAKAGFDLRGPLEPLAPITPRVPSPPPADLLPVDAPVDAVDFVLKKLDEYPLVGIGDLHMCSEFSKFLEKLVSDPRLPGKLQDIVVEFGNPLHQAVVDRYVVDIQPVPLEMRKAVWQEAAMGWYIANSPIYEKFFDTMRSVNLKLPREKRIRVILGDAPIDIEQFRANPEKYMRPFLAYRDTVQDPREMSMAASVNQVLSAGHRGIIIIGNGHLKLMGRPGNARHIFEPAHPGQFYLIDQNGPMYPLWPAPSIVTRQGDPEPNHATLWLGPWDSLTLVRPSPLIYRDRDYWATINLMEEVMRQRFPLDLAAPEFEYRGRYFETH